MTTDLAPRIGDIARRLLGTPNTKLSSSTQLRFGAHGSVAVEIGGSDIGKWYDHEHKRGGGPWEFLSEHGYYDGAAVAWLKSEIGVDVEKLQTKAKKRAKKPFKVVATYHYTDESGNVLFDVCRLDPKDFRQRSPDGAWTVKGIRQVPYRLSGLIAAKGGRVFVMEGEKDCDLAVGLGLVATTNPGGVGKWRAEFARYFETDDVVIIADNDRAGRDHAQHVAASLAPVAARVQILNLPGVPEKGDFTDWFYAAGRTLEEFEALVAEAPIVPSPERLSEITEPIEIAEPEYVSFGEYTMSSAGLHYDPPEDEKPKIWLSAPFEVLALTRDVRSNSWGKLLRWCDPDGTSHEWAMPSEALIGRDEVWRHFLDQGLSIGSSTANRNLLAGYLSAVKTNNRVQCVSRIGWQLTQQQQVFVLPDETLGQEDVERVLWQTETSVDTRFNISGSIEDWRDAVASKCVGNSRLVSAVSAGFAAPLLNIVNDAGGGFHYRGGSQIGKTTILHAAGSVWGGDCSGVNGYLRSWRVTANGLEGIAAGHCDGLLCLDEIGQMEAREVGEAAYMLANGAGKGRATRDGSARSTAQWRLLFLSTGEISLVDKMAEIGRRAHAGQEVRLVDIPADAGAGLGIFENLRGASSAARFADELKRAAFRYYGAPIRQFLRDLVECCAKDRGGLVERVELCRGEFLKAYLPDGASSQVRSVCSRFALIAAGGTLATVFGITGWPDDEAGASAAKCFRAWLGQRGNAGDIEIENAIRQVIVFIEQHGNSRFEAAWDSADERIISRAGFRERIWEDRILPNRTTIRVPVAWQYMVLPEVWRSEVLKGFDVARTTKEMVKRGLIIAGTDAPSSQVKVPKHGNTRVYKLSPEIICGAGNSGNSA